jgi:hypothetical protein
LRNCHSGDPKRGTHPWVNERLTRHPASAALTAFPISGYEQLTAGLEPVGTAA